MPDNQQIIRELIRSISGQDNVLTIPRLYVSLVKSHRAALLLSQSVYWSTRSHAGEGWFWKSYSEWRKELGLNQHAVETCVKLLKAKGLMDTKLERGPSVQIVTWYRVNMESLTLAVSAIAVSAIPTLAETAKVHKRKTIMSSYESKITTKTPSSSAPQKPPPDLAAVIKSYSNNIGVPSPIILDSLKDAVKIYSAEWVLKAIEQAVMNEIRKWSYIEAILKTWKERGFDKSGQSKQGKNGAYKHGQPAPSAPLPFDTQQTNKLLALNMDAKSLAYITEHKLTFEQAVAYLGG